MTGPYIEGPPDGAQADDRALFAALPHVDGPAVARLQDRLAVVADRAGVLDVAFRDLATPVGTLLLAATGRGLLRVAFPGEGHDTVLAELAQQVSPRILHAPARLDAVARQLDEYFTSRRTTFDLPLDLRLAAGFRRGVLTALGGVGYGTTTTYARLAANLGRPGASRAVGAACAANPLPVVLPCHRVIRTDGALAGYIGGLAAKQALLDLERSSVH